MRIPRADTVYEHAPARGERLCVLGYRAAVRGEIQGQGAAGRLGRAGRPRRRDRGAQRRICRYRIQRALRIRQAGIRGIRYRQRVRAGAVVHEPRLRVGRDGGHPGRGNYVFRQAARLRDAAVEPLLCAQGRVQGDPQDLRHRYAVRAGHPRDDSRGHRRAHPRRRDGASRPRGVLQLDRQGHVQLHLRHGGAGRVQAGLQGRGRRDIGRPLYRRVARDVCGALRGREK